MAPESVLDELRDLPAELRARTPRSVRMTGTGWLNVFAGAFFFLLGPAGIIYAIEPARHDATSSLSLGFLILAGGVSFIGLLLVRRLPLQRHPAIDGIGARGCITECSGPSRSGHFLTYTFRNANNNEVEIGSCHSDLPRKVGSIVWVLYLPANPSRSEIYPFDVACFRIDQ